ncbi:hypothetical protein COU78_03795 [Candidatus Peregrinibacteria bacterium CG10_big_fil_rev_8_21_14_0_10_49_24]|nr:MAG: hypothetical protein COV83_05610 [Candidatus Peregrinibacteria bacterium CG11_big_fil_rev_8_21_14_0_20_49_14]PIR51239.1 MAG: hypothetical protein COU78_03795 [Candidatus Peregrinibacteria bacterium CG10_big_fil_rev_8_21_14_0_10_49_24]PJA67277.1 MAG: hypothetical protein CO157_05950 [Candidatus Peregrinibacteria bacterium CG_4_9_14_3_um_filter_49_12]
MASPEQPTNQPPQALSFVEQVHNLRDEMEESLRELRESRVQVQEQDVPSANPFERARVYENTRKLLQYISENQERLLSNEAVQEQLLRLKKFLDEQQAYNDMPVVSTILKNPGRAGAILGSLVAALAINKVANAVVKKEQKGVLFHILKFSGVLALSSYIVSKFPVSPKDSELAPSVRGTVETVGEVQVHTQFLGNDFVVGGARKGDLQNTVALRTSVEEAFRGKDTKKQVSVIVYCEENQKQAVTTALNPMMQQLRTAHTDRTFQLRLLSKKPPETPNGSAPDNTGN